MFILNEKTYLGKASLNVENLDSQIDFYTNKIGMKLIDKNENKAVLGVKDRVLLELVEIKSTKHRKVTGLYHIAYRLPSRIDLANALFSLLMRNVELDGAADHGYSEALYLTDPEGNGIEIYTDKDKSLWDIREDGTIKGVTDPLDADDLLTNLTAKEPVNLPYGTIIGHIHLSIVDLYNTKDFYLEKLGFNKKYEFPRQAIFMAAGEYHHHIAINVWNSSNMELMELMELRDERDLGLNYFEICVDKKDFELLEDRFKDSFYPDDKKIIIKDNQNIEIHLVIMVD